MKRSVLVCVTCALALVVIDTTRLWSQTLPVTVDSRVRITTAQPGGSPLTGTVTDRRSGVLVVHGERGDTATIPFATIRRLEVSRGRHPHLLTGALVGVVGGAGIGAIVGATVPDKGFRVVDRGALTAIGAGLGSGAGVIVGTIVGALIRTERWQDVPLTSLTFRGDVPTFGAVASTGGVGLALPVPWLGH